MATNRWILGALYPYPSGLNGVAWKQAAPFALVYPQQQTSAEYFEVTPFNEATGIFRSICGHSVMGALVQREYDYNTNQSVALICCPLCGAVNWTVSPFEAALDTVEAPWLVL